MKRIFLLSLFTGVMLVSILAYPQATPKVTTNGSIPKEVYNVFKQSCMACHGTGGRQITLSMLNISKWDEYKTATKAKKAAAICDMVTKDVMPPRSYQKSTPTSVVTPVQKDLVCTWSKTVISPK